MLPVAWPVSVEMTKAKVFASSTFVTCTQPSYAGWLAPLMHTNWLTLKPWLGTVAVAVPPVSVNELNCLEPNSHAAKVALGCLPVAGVAVRWAPQR